MTPEQQEAAQEQSRRTCENLCRFREERQREEELLRDQKREAEEPDRLANLIARSREER